MTTADLQLGIDASGAKRGGREFVGAIASIKAAMSGLKRDTDGLFQKLNATTKNAAPRNVKAQFTAINSAVRSAESSVGTLHRQLNKIGNAAGLKRVDSAMEQFRRETSATELTTTELRAAQDRLAQSLHEVRQGVREATEIQRLRTQYQRMTAAVDEASTAAHPYRRHVQAVEQAHRAGAISTQQMTHSLQLAKAAYKGAGNEATISAAKNARFFGTLAGWGQNFDLRGVSMQLSQVAQQGAVTGNYLQALMVQLPDLALGFGPVGIMAGAAAGALGTVLVGAMTKTDKEAKKLKNQVHALSTALDSLEQNSQASSAQIAAHLKSTFGDVAGDVQSLIEDLRAAEFSVISHKMRKEVEASTKQLTSLSGAFEIFWADFANPGSVDSGYLNQMTEIIAKSKISYGEFQKLEQAVNSVFQARDVNEFVENLSRARALGAEIGGPIGTKIADVMLKAAENGGVLNRVTSDAASNANGLTTELSEAERKALELAGVDISKGISEATTEAARLAANLNIALLDAINLKNLQDSKVYSGRGGDPRQFGNGYTPPKLASTTRRTGGAKLESSLTRTTQQLKAQNIALKALAEGMFETDQIARVYAETLLTGNGVVDAATMSALKQADAVAKANEELQRIVSTNNESLSSATKDGVKDGIKQGLQQALNGDGANFAQTLANSVRSRMAGVLSDKIVDSLGIDELFNFGGVTAAAQMQAGIVSGSAQGAAIMAQAIATGQVSANAASAASTGGGFFGFIGSIFGFDEGVANTSNPGAWQKVPQFAEGTPNTSGGMHAILHPNEAVIPLSRGRKVPVELTRTGHQNEASLIEDVVTRVRRELHLETHTRSIEGSFGIEAAAARINASIVTGGDTAAKMISAAMSPPLVVGLQGPETVAVDLQAPAASVRPAVLHQPPPAPTEIHREKIVETRGGFTKSITMGDVNINVDGGGDDDAELAAKIARRFEETVEGIVDTRIAESAGYGGALNPRGGR